MSPLASHLSFAVAIAVMLLLAKECWDRRIALKRLRLVLGYEPKDGAYAIGETIARFSGKKLAFASDDTLRNTLNRAGYTQPMALPAFVFLRLVAIGAVVVLALYVNTDKAAATQWAIAAFSAFACSRLFIGFLKVRANSRQQRVRRELPSVIDLLLMVLNSGASIDQSLRYVGGIADATAPLVASNLRQCQTDVDNGVPYDLAFERFGQRLAIEEGYDLAALIKQGLLQGGEVVGALDRFSAELSEKRVSAAREQIGRKSTHLTIVMLAFFMPVLMVILAGPAVSNIFETLGTVKAQLHAKGARQ